MTNDGEERKQNDELKMEAGQKRAVNYVAVANTLVWLTKKILVHAQKYAILRNRTPKNSAAKV